MAAAFRSVCSRHARSRTRDPPCGVTYQRERYLGGVPHVRRGRSGRGRRVGATPPARRRHVSIDMPGAACGCDTRTCAFLGWCVCYFYLRALPMGHLTRSVYHF